MLRLAFESPRAPIDPVAALAVAGAATASTIITPRLTLRPFHPADHRALHAIMARPETFAFGNRAPLTEEESWARLLRNIGHWAAFGFGLFAVEDRATGALVGEVGLADFRRHIGADFDGVPEASWTIAPDKWGRGFALEAAIAIHQWLAEQGQEGCTVCMIDPRNFRSISIAGRLGYAAFAERPHRGKDVFLFRRVIGPASRNS